MSNSSLVNYTKVSPNKTAPRNHRIDTITIHCVVGQLSVETMGRMFADPDFKASCNYAIGSDGRIALIVDEKDRSWCSSSRSNDHRAITIECASDTKHPYAINDKVYASLIDLVADICKRNGIAELKWKADKFLVGQVNEQNMTVHRWFANKACPGDYIYSRLGQIANEVNMKLSGKAPGASTTEAHSEKGSGKSFEVRIDTPVLNIRTGPGKGFARTGKYTGKGVFTITDTRPGEGSYKGWGRLKSGAGWISLDYARRL